MKAGPLLFAMVLATEALDLTWIPADKDGPLPMSARFRDKLRQLCLHESLPAIRDKAKRKQAKKMCKQLEEADNRSTLGLDSESGSYLFLALVAAAALVVFGQQREQPPIQEPAAPSVSATAAQTAEARAARLRAFEERPKLTEQQEQMLANLKQRR